MFIDHRIKLFWQILWFKLGQIFDDIKKAELQVDLQQKGGGRSATNFPWPKWSQNLEHREEKKKS